MGVNKTHTHQKNENKAPLASIKSALSRLEADYKNNKNGMISKEDVAWYNNILGITKSSDWLTKVGEIRTRLQRMIG
ncbi:hypothetical protein H6769_03765 [Candidatus Peribacteria bacterium]|nr:hypothetical protein [Candidatus Peribacteria bacterium]